MGGRKWCKGKTRISAWCRGVVILFVFVLFCFFVVFFFRGWGGGGWGRAERLVFPVLFPEYARNVNENYSDCHYIKIVKENKYICQAIFFNSYKQLLR